VAYLDVYSHFRGTSNVIILSKIALGYVVLLGLSVVALVFVWALREVCGRITRRTV
jgi:hypothetical protein